MVGTRVETLDQLTDFSQADDSHRRVVAHYAERNAEMERNMRFVRGDHYTPEEKDAYAATSRVPIVMNKLLAPFRTVIGTFLQAMFEPGFSPVGDEDQALADALSKLAQFESTRADDLLENGQIAGLSWILGRAYRRIWPEQNPGEQSRCMAEILNPFGVYPDPDSKTVISRDDAEFYDIVHWLGLEQILRLFPESAKDVDENILQQRVRSIGIDFVNYNKSADRGHESMDIRGSMFKVVERYYRCYRKQWFTVDGETGDPVEVDEIEQFRKMFPGAPVFPKTSDFLHVAIWAPGLMTAAKSFLFNGPYHVQPRNPDTGRCMWPIAEQVSDSLLGESDGFVKALRDPQKLVDVLYTQLVENAKHSGSGYEQDPSKYATPEEASRAKRLGAHANQRYEMKPGQAGQGMVAIQPQNVPPANGQALNVADSFMYEASAAPPAMQGIAEGSSTAASLNAQRIEQAGVQLTQFITFFKSYTRQILRLRYAYWRETYTDERVVRITSEGNKSERVELNKMVPETDPYGDMTGGIAKINDISAAEFDVVINDSQASPTYRAKVLKSIEAMMANPAVAANPAMAGPLADWFFRLSDAPAELKEQVRAGSQAMQAQAQAQQPGAVGTEPGQVQQVMDSLQQVPMEAQ